MTDTAQDQLCPRCHSTMPSPISVYELQPKGIPRSKYVCRACHREWLRGGGLFGESDAEVIGSTRSYTTVC